MKKELLIENLLQNHQSFVEMINQLSDDKFMSAPQEKWTAGQQLEHILKSVKPLVKVLQFPKLVLQTQFGEVNRPSMTYNVLVELYLEALKNGGKATEKFIPQMVDLSAKNTLIENLMNEVKQMTSALDNFSEDELDKYFIPHPLLGNFTVREMMYFTMYHVTHHQKSVESFEKI